jgi:hypothetical protein
MSRQLKSESGDGPATQLRAQILQSLRKQGFRLRGDKIVPQAGQYGKAWMRDLHAVSVQHKIDKAKNQLEQKETELLTYIAYGDEVDPAAIVPRLIEVKPRSKEELLFRYAVLHWSIPVSSGYGRRLRFIVWDEQNDKLMGLIGLGDPVFGIKARDTWIGWDSATRRARLRYVMDAFVLGAVPPYSELLCGKLVALLATSTEVRKAFCRKYRGNQSVISGEHQDGRLALITTTSALGRSSLYNRLRLNGQLAYESVGYTLGSGEFQFCNGLYSAIRTFAESHCDATAKQKEWGTGFRNRREVVKKCLASVGLSSDLVFHGLKREVFVAPLAKNSTRFLKGEQSRLLWKTMNADEIFEFFRNRWLLPRAARNPSYRAFSPSAWRLW